MLMGACSSSGTNPKQNDETNNKQGVYDKSDSTRSQEQNKEGKPLTESEVLDSIKNEIHTKIPIILPKKLPIKDEQHLTATTESGDSQYIVMFFTSSDPIPINNEKLNNGSQEAAPLARLTVHEYDTMKEADERIAFQDFSKLGGQEIDLGYDIKGYQDAGAGSMWTSEGRWALTSHTQTSKADDGVKLARHTVGFLNENVLPIPKPNGYVHVDATGTNNQILWQNGKTVFTIDQVKDPMFMLKIAAMFE
jgi:hypothetical protein